MRPCWACVGPAGLSSDSGLGGSTDGSTDVLVFESVVDSVTEEGEWTLTLITVSHCVTYTMGFSFYIHLYMQSFTLYVDLNCIVIYWCSECEVSEDSSNEAEVEPEASDPEDSRDLDPGALLYKACQARNLPVMAEALAHGADVNSVNEEDEGKSPLIQAVIGVSLFYKCF